MARCFTQTNGRRAVYVLASVRRGLEYNAFTQNLCAIGVL